MPELETPAAQADRILKGFSYLLSAIRLGSDARRLLEGFLSKEEISLLDNALGDLTKLKVLPAFDPITSPTVPVRDVTPAGKRPKAPKRDRLLEVVDVEPADIEAARAMIGFWRKEDPKDSRTINADPQMTVQRIVEIRKRQPLFTPDILVAAGRAYCNSHRDRYKAPQYFLSLTPDPDTSKPPFYPYVLPLVHARRNG